MNKQNNDNVIELKIKVDSQMDYEVREYMKRYKIATFEEAVFRLFEYGRDTFRNQLDSD